MGKAKFAGWHNAQLITQEIRNGRSYLTFRPLVGRKMTEEEMKENERVMKEHARINNLTIGKLGTLPD